MEAGQLEGLIPLAGGVSAYLIEIWGHILISRIKYVSPEFPALGMSAEI